MPSQLPDRPNLDQLKKQAKSLLHAAQAGEADALAAVRRVARVCEQVDRRNRALRSGAPRCAVGDRPRARVPVLDGAARGSRSANAVVRGGGRRVPARATGGASGRAEPAARAPSEHRDGHAADRARARRRRGGRGAAARPSGARDTTRRTAELGAAALCVPHVHARGRAARASTGLVTIARRLCALGANPNAEYHWNWHPELPRTALWGAICAVRHLPLAEVLLEAGANPTDGVSVHIAGGGGNIDALELLHRYGVNVNGIPAACRRSST